MEKKQYLIFDSGKNKFAIATLVKKEWKPEEEYSESGGDVYWYEVDFHDGTRPTIDRCRQVFFLIELKDRFENPTEALKANLPEVISFILRMLSGVNSSLHPRYI